MNKKKIGIMLGICILGISIPMVAMAETSLRRANIKSKGNIDYENGKVYFAASDLTYLADEIDHLENKYKSTIVNALNEIGTFFLKDGTVINDRSRNEVNTEEEKASLAFGSITEGIRKSQSVDSLAGVQATDADGNLLYYTSEDAKNNQDMMSLTTTDTGLPVFYQAANTDNLTAGTAAWVNGKLLRGNGKDYLEYADNYIQSQGYSKIVDLGEGTSFDVSGYSDYQLFTEDNFIVELVRAKASGVTKVSCGLSGGGSAAAEFSAPSFEMTKDYDAEYGVLTVDPTSKNIVLNSNRNNAMDLDSTGKQTYTYRVYLMLN